MDIGGSEHRDSAVGMLAVVPREEGSAQVDRLVDVREAAGESGVVLDGLEVRLRDGVVVTYPGPAEGDRRIGPSGKCLGSHVVETNARPLIEVLRGIPQNRHLCLEEGTLSG